MLKDRANGSLARFLSAHNFLTGSLILILLVSKWTSLTAYYLGLASILLKKNHPLDNPFKY
jgi:hypothetical protein